MNQSPCEILAMGYRNGKYVWNHKKLSSKMEEAKRIKHYQEDNL